MTAARILAAAAAIAALLAVPTIPAAAQSAPGTGTSPAAEATQQQASAPLSAAPVLGSGFALEGVWLTPSVASLGWDDVAAAAGYELMYRSADGWLLLSEHEPQGGVVAAFDGSAARVGGLPQDEAEWWFAVRARNTYGVSEWSASAAVAVPPRSEAEPLFDPFTAPTRSGIDLERLREAVATITP